MATNMEFHLIIVSLVISGVLTCHNMREVSQCPRNETEWNGRAKSLNCTYAPKDDVYHCVLDHLGNKLVEVCAPIEHITGSSCAEFNCFGHRIHKSSYANCTSCPFSYPSNEAYKYQSCYEIVYQREKERWSKENESITTIVKDVNWTPTMAFITSINTIGIVCIGFCVTRMYMNMARRYDNVDH